MDTRHTYRFLVYNIRYCTGFGWRFHTPFPFSGYLRSTQKGLQQIKGFIEEYNPDITALIEVDGGSRRSGGMNQARQIAAELGHDYIFATKYQHQILNRFMPLMKNQGNACLVSRKILSRRYHYFKKGIKRLIIEVELDNMICFLVHLSIKHSHRQNQLEFLSELICRSPKPVVVGGDFNVFSGPEELEAFLNATNLESANFNNYLTFPSKKPRWELDYIFLSPEITAQNIHVPRVTLSDHLPMVCDFTIN
ncbi:MAG: endonuclease/exonuclease/phosphatase family protein [Thermodesulfobacteriota bacterium]|nr:endonuclease/exonuclease/phosphatase family protein [Thermodesulfobacteriota bacterium]